MTKFRISEDQIIDGKISSEILTQLYEKRATELDLSYCENLTELTELPESLKKVNLFGCKNLQKLSKLPLGLNELGLINCKNLTELLAFPSGLTEIDLMNCEKLIKLPELPSGLNELSLINCKNLIEIPALPPLLAELDLTHCKKLTKLPALPQGLKDLNLERCANIVELPKLPQSLTDLYLSDCVNLKQLPDLPKSLKDLRLENCTTLATLPELPRDLTKLNLEGCERIEKLPEIPGDLTKLNLRNCNKITTLPELPQGLNRLDLFGCDNLLFTPELIDKLARLTEKDPACEIFYPKHFNPSTIEGAKTRLNQAIATYHEDQDNKTNPLSNSIKTLFRRYLTEGIEHRINQGNSTRKANEIAKSTEPFLKIIERNPKHLSWIDEIAKTYLDACINQPVAGFSEINAFVEIAQADTISQKVLAAKHLIALQEIKNTVRQDSPGAEVEVEAGNALLIELHNQLREEGKIKEPWLAVPEKIAYAETIKSWIDRKKEDGTIKELKEFALNLTKEKCANFLCETIFSDIWEKIAFSDNSEIRAIKEEYGAKLEKVLETENTETPEGIQQIVKDREKAIRTTIKELTYDALEIKEASQTPGTNPNPQGGKRLAGKPNTVPLP